MTARLLHGDLFDVLPTLDACSIDAIVCDPPYALEFMGKSWDSFRLDDPGTARYRGEHAGAQGNIEDAGSERPSRVAYGGGKRSSTFRCVGCGKRDQFRKPHACVEGTRWAKEIIDPHAAPPTMVAFGEWCRRWATEAYRVLKPGGFLLAFGGTRTQHRLVCGIEDAGFEIRDRVLVLGSIAGAVELGAELDWVHGQGFPKSLDVSKALDAKLGEERADRVVSGEGSNKVFRPSRAVIDAGSPATAAAAAAAAGWGTALKPAHEPVVVARKPFAGSVAENVLEHGVGGMNIMAARVGDTGGVASVGPRAANPDGVTDFPGRPLAMRELDAGRWPANVALLHLAECKGAGANHTDVLCADGCPVAEMNEQSGKSRSSAGEVMYSQPSAPATPHAANPASRTERRTVKAHGYGDEGGAARFFYVAKPKTRERVGGTVRNLHPTVKPVELMRWLVRLVTPAGGVVLDPFLGSGSTGCAAMVEGVSFIGVEQDADYYETCVERIADWAFAHGQPRPERC